MSRNPEQQAADEQLLAAIENIIRVDELLDEETILLDFVVTMEGQKLDDSRAYFAAAYKGGQCRSTVAVGMLIYNLQELLKD